MTQPYLYLRYRGSSPQMAAFKEVNRQLLQIGSDFGEPLSVISDSIICQWGRICHWENDLYAISNSGIWKYTVDAPDPDWEFFYKWQAVQTNDVDRNEMAIGFTSATVEGQPVLVTGYCNNDSADESMVIVKLTPTGVVEGPVITDIVNGYFGFNELNCFGKPLAHRDSIYWVASVGRVYRYNLKTDHVTKMQVATTASQGIPTICTFRDRVYAHQTYTSTSASLLRSNLYRLDENRFTDILELPLASGFTTTGTANQMFAQTNTHPHMVFPHDDNSLFIFRTKTDNGIAALYTSVFQVYFDNSEPPQITQVVDRTQQVLPSNFYDGTWSNTDRGIRWSLRRDPITDGIDSKRYTLALSRDSTQTEAAADNTVDLYSWVAPTGSMSFIDSGLNHFTFSRIHTPNSTGGMFIWPGSGTLNISPPELNIVPGGNRYIDATFTLYGPGTSGVAIELCYSKDDGFIDKIGTIVSASTGTLSGNRVIGLVADGTTEVTVRWDAEADGIEREDNPTVCGQIFIP